MGLCCGMIGLPNVGKTTVFNALVGAGGVVANYPFSTVKANIGVSAVYDSRLASLAKAFRSKKITPSTLEVRDIAGLVPGASRGEGLGNEFLAQIREVDALLHLVRCFPDLNVVHVIDEVNPLRDIGVIEAELGLADLEILERRRERLDKQVKAGNGPAQNELSFVSRLESLLNQGSSLYSQIFSPEENRWLREYQLLSNKPVFYVANVSDGVDSCDALVKSVVERGAKSGTKTISLKGQLEAELTSLADSEREEFFRELGLEELGLQRLWAAAFEVLGLITFFTAGEEESRAWTITKGTSAQVAAGKVHSDMQRGFIRAEVIAYTDFEKYGNPTALREKGLIRLEGRDYTVKDGDIMYFRFNV